MKEDWRTRRILLYHKSHKTWNIEMSIKTHFGTKVSLEKSAQRERAEPGAGLALPEEE